MGRRGKGEAMSVTNSNHANKDKTYLFLSPEPETWTVHALTCEDSVSQTHVVYISLRCFGESKIVSKLKVRTTDTKSRSGWHPHKDSANNFPSFLTESGCTFDQAGNCHGKHAYPGAARKSNNSDCFKSVIFLK